MRCIQSLSAVICQTTGPKPLPKRFLHIVRSRASSFNWQYPLLSLRSSSSFLRLLPRLLVTSICPFIFPSITCCRRQFLRQMWPIQLAFCFLISCRIFLCSLTLSNMLPKYLKHFTLNEFFRKSIIFKVQKQPLENRRLGKTNIKQCTMTCHFELDTGAGTAKGTVESTSTLH